VARMGKGARVSHTPICARLAQAARNSIAASAHGAHIWRAGL